MMKSMHEIKHPYRWSQALRETERGDTFHFDRLETPPFCRETNRSSRKITPEFVTGALMNVCTFIFD